MHIALKKDRVNDECLKQREQTLKKHERGNSNKKQL